MNNHEIICECDQGRLFVCNQIGCKMKFQTQNSLNTHKKRHDINISINSKQIGYTDQTPTPTRFLKNCEEVGLFQDLQANPFEETFRKAFEALNCGTDAKDISSNIADDTLHTPKVFPISHEFQQCKDDGGDKISNTASIAMETVSVPAKKVKYSGRKRKACVLYEDQSTQCDNNFVALGRNVTFKLPIPRLPPCVKILPNNYSVLSKNALKTNKTSRTKRKEKIEKLSLLESNRLAQKRARDKRKLFYKELVEKNAKLEEKVDTLLKENAMLKQKLELKCSLDKQNTPNERLEMPVKLVTLEKEDATVSSSIRFLESCLPILDTGDRPVAASTEVISQVVLRKPFKKRDIHPKLFLSCKPLSNI